MATSPTCSPNWRAFLVPRSSLRIATRTSSSSLSSPPGFVADLLATVQVRYPNVPIVFCGTRPLAEEWVYRFLGAALAFLTAELQAEEDNP